MAISILDSPTIFTCVHGYNPFTPDAGIFCGGYQGPMYPNPMTLILPDIDFDPKQFQRAMATPYIMKNTGDIYEGIGVGNPSINYRNPGHILGIMDTYGRMSYGIGIIKAARDEELGSTITPPVTITLNLLKLGPDLHSSPATLTFDNLYPSFSEKPSDYLDAFTDGDSLLLDPREDEPYIFTGTKHQPIVNLIDMQSIFLNILTRSYYGIPETFQEAMSGLVDTASDFNNDIVIELTTDGLGGTIGQQVDSLPNPIDDMSQIDQPASPVIEFLSDDLGQYEYKNKCNAINVVDALKITTGEDQFHPAINNTYEYRTLTELNSVINILPVQTHALKYVFEADTTNTIWPLVSCAYYVQYFICDICINTFQKGSITIGGNARITSLESDLSSPLLLTHVERQFLLSTSLTNKFTWDRAWFGLDEINTTSILEQNNFYLSEAIEDDTIAIAPGLDYDLLTPFTDFGFNKSFNVGDGAHSIRTRIIAKSKVLSFFGQPTVNGHELLELTLNIDGINFNLTYNFELS